MQTNTREIKSIRVNGREVPAVKASDLMPGDRDINGTEIVVIERNAGKVTFRNSNGTYTKMGRTLVALYAERQAVAGADLQANIADAHFKAISARGF